MRNGKLLWISLFLCAACIAAPPPAGSDDATQIIQLALGPSPLESNLRHLTDEIGGRVPGTRAMEHAIQWGIRAFTVAGADSVHSEGFTLPQSWSEGATE